MRLLPSHRFGFLFLFFWLMASSSSAQYFSGGLVLGVNASQVDGDLVAGFNKAGLSAGGFLSYPLNDRIGLQGELLFEELGSAFELGRIVRTRHISLPLVLTVNLPVDLGGGSQEIQFHGGLTGGLLLRADDFNGEITPLLNRMDLRAVGGLAYRFSGRIALMLRYGYSVTTFVPVESAIGPVQSIIAPGRTGLFHHYVNFSLRYYLAE